MSESKDQSQQVKADSAASMMDVGGLETEPRIMPDVIETKPIKPMKELMIQRNGEVK